MPTPSNKLSEARIDVFLAKHRLTPTFNTVIEACYLPLVSWLSNELMAESPLIVGINGAQGTGKSTLADFLATALAAPDLNVAVLSIDDFYLSPKDRQDLARDIHPLLATRGVPGTHDLAQLSRCLDQLITLRSGESMDLPRFDKALDSQAPHERWPTVNGPVQLIIVEGWCVASQPQSEQELMDPINPLEAEQDPDGLWRRYVNRQLSYTYAEVFNRLDRLVFLAAPSFDTVCQWRGEQELKLAEGVSADSPGLMGPGQLQSFMQHYQRLTGHNLRTLPAIADVQVSFDHNHQCSDIVFRK